MVLLTAFASVGCNNAESRQPPPPPLPVKTKTITLEAVPRVDEYVATVKSRRSANIQPQVDGTLTRILVKSGDHVRAGQPLMTIDPLKQQARSTSSAAPRHRKKPCSTTTRSNWSASSKLYEAG